MKLVTLDPGESIGYAVFVDEKRTASGTEKFPDSLRLMNLLVKTKPDMVVAERVIPWGIGALSLHISGVMHDIENAFYYHPNFHWIKAAQWKPLISRETRRKLYEQRKKEVPDRIVTVHESDALCIATYVFRFRRDWIRLVKESSESATSDLSH